MYSRKAVERFRIKNVSFQTAIGATEKIRFTFNFKIRMKLYAPALQGFCWQFGKVCGVPDTASVL